MNSAHFSLPDANRHVMIRAPMKCIAFPAGLLLTIVMGIAAPGVITKPILTLRGHTSSIHCVAWSPDGKRLASGSPDNTVKVWDAASGKILHTLQGHSITIEGVAFSPDSKRLASGSRDRTVKIWQTASGRLLHTLQGHTFQVWSVAWSPDGKRLASGSWDGSVKVWETSSGRELHTLRGNKFQKIESVAWSPDGKRLASSGFGETVKVWEVPRGKLLQTLQGGTRTVKSVTWSPDGKRLAIASDKTVKVWETSSGRVLHTHKESEWGGAMSVAWSPDGKRLASGGHGIRGKTVKVWDAGSGRQLHTLQGHADNVYSVAWSPDGKHLVSGSSDGTLKVWEVPKFGPLMGSGTGFFITDDGYLLTNNHVVDQASSVTVKVDDKELEARVVKVDKQNDLAVLKVEGKYPALPVISSRKVALGAEVFTVGFPRPGVQGKLPKLTKGVISSLAGIRDDPRNFQISVQIQPGNSGGPLADEYGNVLGVVVASLNAEYLLARSRKLDLPQDVNYAVKGTFATGFLESLPKVASKLKDPNPRTKPRKFTDVVKKVQAATVLILVR